MHRAPEYLRSNVFIYQDFRQNSGVCISGSHVVAVINCLYRDALDYFYSAVISVCDAIRGIESGFFSWSVVKLYYSVFYLLRAELAAGLTCVVYVKNTPCSVKIRAGSVLLKGSGNTHTFVLELYKKCNPGSLFLSQEIGMVNSLDWIARAREEINYKQSMFSEPSPPSVLKRVVDSRLDIAVQNYLSDKDKLYVFDPDHAILAFPLSLMCHVDVVISTSTSFRLPEENRKFLLSLMSKYRLCRDRDFALLS